ncbi:hypothetical protein Trydic_g7482 [Trypoxylus dichotomus]
MRKSLNHNAELADMHFMYGSVNGDTKEAVHLYDFHPNTQMTSGRVLIMTIQPCHRRGNFSTDKQESGSNLRKISAEVGINALLA